MIKINHDPKTRDLRVFALLQLAFFAFIAWKIRQHTSLDALAIALVSCAAVAAVVGVFRPSGVRLYFVGWLYAVFPIGWFVSHTLIVAIYYLMLTPLGWLARVCRHDPLRLRRDPDATSYWVERPPNEGTGRYFKQY